MKYITIFLFFAFNSILEGQTVGVIQKSIDVMDGYTFFSPFSSTKAFIVDNCGNLIKQWNRGTRPGLAAYFLDNGLMLRTYKANLVGPFTSASNAGGLELVDWDNNTIWKYEINTEEQLSHHDAVMMPNGNILTLTWELTYRQELVELGRHPYEIAPENYMWSEKIVELEPVGNNDANIVWEWHINDHYIQDFDNTKSGFGVIAEHPELFNINLPQLNSSNSNSTRDWNHFNSIDYNDELDQILISTRNSDEIWILDHSTTTEEAASHEGGKYGKGGDILYRWGNASTYNQALVSDQQLFGQHGVHWIDEGLDNEGQIMIYNNGNGQAGQDYSRVQILVPPQDSSGYYSRTTDSPFGPTFAQDVYGNLENERFYSAYLSNAQILPNGNVLINEGSSGFIFEITPEREIVWEYEIPLFGDFPATQGQSVSNNANFRAYKFPLDFKGFDGLDLTPGQPIEIDPLPCELQVSLDDPIAFAPMVLVDSQNKTIEINLNETQIRHINIFNSLGSVVYSSSSFSENTPLIDISNFSSGLYFISVMDKTNEMHTQAFFR